MGNFLIPVVEHSLDLQTGDMLTDLYNSESPIFLFPSVVMALPLLNPLLYTPPPTSQIW